MKKAESIPPFGYTEARPATVATQLIKQTLAPLPLQSARAAPAAFISMPLTARENQVMKLLAKGLLDKEIADELGIRPGTVHNYVRTVFGKLGVSNRTEAAIKFLGLNSTQPGIRAG